MSPDLLAEPVERVMTREPMVIRPDALAAKALGVMNAGRRLINALLVVQDRKPVGIVSVHDLLRAGIM
jgi:arabinose-5-phosphate isomerase